MSKRENSKERPSRFYVVQKKLIVFDSGAPEGLLWIYDSKRDPIPARDAINEVKSKQGNDYADSKEVIKNWVRDKFGSPMIYEVGDSVPGY